MKKPIFIDHSGGPDVWEARSMMAEDYALGEYEPRFPVPAIPLRVVVGTEYMYDTVYIEIASDEDPVIVALWDFNFDRCIDFNTPLGEYQRWNYPCLSTRGEDALARMD